MNFEFDPMKSEANLAKHGIDFLEAQDLWLDRDRLEFRLDHAGEQRYGLLARMWGSCWLCIMTYRGESIRIISARRATKKEASLYEKTNHGR